MPECRNTHKKVKNVRWFNFFGHDKLRTFANFFVKTCLVFL